MLASYRQAFLDGLTPEPDLTVSDWADKHRVLVQTSSAIPGRWETRRTPYLREIMDCMSATSPVQQVVFQKGAQIGASESAINFILYAIHHAPAPMLYVLPTTEMVERFSKQRIAPAIEVIPEVCDLVADFKSKTSSNTLRQKDFRGGTMILNGANSATGLRSMPARYLVLDEVDAYPLDASDEGSPIELAITRTTTYKQTRKIFLISTPKIKGLSAIENYYSQSDKRRYYVPCPHCGHMQYLTLELNIVWKKDQPETAKFMCIECAEVSDEHHKQAMLEAGEWRATGDTESAWRGYHLSSLYSPAEWYSWSDAAAQFLAANKGGPEQLKHFINTVLGETWEEQGLQIAVEGLIDRCETYPLSLLDTDRFEYTTVAVDIQGDRIEYEHVGWGEGRESWALNYGVIEGDTAQSDVWRDLRELINELDPDGVCIDSGHQTQFVYNFVKDNVHWWAVKGRGGAGYALIEDRQKRAMRLRKKKLRSHVVEPIGVDQGKDIVMSNLQIEPPTGNEPVPGYMHYPAGGDFDDEYFAQLTAEKKVIKKLRDGRLTYAWKQTRPRNEALDLRVYGLACVELLETTKRKRSRQKQEAQPKTQQERRARKTRGFSEGGAWL